MLAQDDGPAAAQRTSCEHVIASAEDCFAAAKSIEGLSSTATVQTSQGSSDSLAAGCTVTYDQSKGVVRAENERLFVEAMFIAYKKTIFLPRQARDKHRKS